MQSLVLTNTIQLNHHLQQLYLVSNDTNHYHTSNTDQPEGSNQMDVELRPDITKMSNYLERENNLLMHNYGPQVFEFNQELDKESKIDLNFLKRHQIESTTRTKMVDWMIEVLYAYYSDPPTFYLAIHIMDTFIAKSKIVLNNAAIHLIGIVSIYIASKMEDIIPLRMQHVKVKIGHNFFSEKTIKRQEKLILETINFELITTSIYEYIKTYFYDLNYNNREHINLLALPHVVEMFENTAIYVSKLILHCDRFVGFT
jgi:hypothetical protein